MSDVVLLSGGVDSLVCAELAHRAGTLAACVFVDYGHPSAQQESYHGFGFCRDRGIRLVVRHSFHLDLGQMATGDGPQVVPHRNLMLLGHAANLAASIGATGIVIGANADDQADYEDCRRPFFDAVELATGLVISTPLLRLAKPSIVRMARDLDLTARDAWSCYGAGLQPCGVCASCSGAVEAWSLTDGVYRTGCCGRTGRELEANGHDEGCNR